MSYVNVFVLIGLYNGYAMGQNRFSALLALCDWNLITLTS